MPDDQQLDEEPENPEAEAAWHAWQSMSTSRRRGHRPAGADAAPRHRPRVLLGVLLALVLVIVALVLVIVLRGSGTSAPKNGGALSQVESAHAALMSHRQDCSAEADQVHCRQAAAEALSLAYRDFNVDLDGIALPASANNARDTLEQDADLLSNAYDELSVATSAAAYQRISTREDVPGLESDFGRHYTALVAVLRTG